jgi:hypothetical protein
VARALSRKEEGRGTGASWRRGMGRGAGDRGDVP